MVKTGDRVELESEKVGQAQQTGVVTAVAGELITVRWSTGRETTVVPSAGALRVIGSEQESGEPRA